MACGLWSKSGPSSVFINKVLVEQSGATEGHSGGEGLTEPCLLDSLPLSRSCVRCVVCWKMFNTLLFVGGFAHSHGVNSPTMTNLGVSSLPLGIILVFLCQGGSYLMHVIKIYLLKINIHQID